MECTQEEQTQLSMFDEQEEKQQRSQVGETCAPEHTTCLHYPANQKTPNKAANISQLTLTGRSIESEDNNEPLVKCNKVLGKKYRSQIFQIYLKFKISQTDWIVYPGNELYLDLDSHADACVLRSNTPISSRITTSGENCN